MLVIEKIAGSFISLPGLFIILWAVVTVYLLVKPGSKFIRMLAFLTLILMYITFTGTGTYLFVLPLEKAFPVRDFNDFIDPYPVVVMGGGINYHGHNRAELNQGSLQRLVKGYQLHRELKTPVVYTGGVGIGYSGLSEADIACDWLLRMGVQEEEIVKESRARTTYENGLYIKEWLDGQGYRKIYLVTSAIHMTRSAAVFNRQGIETIPVPSGYLVSHKLSWLDYLPNRSSLNANLAGIHEWLGIIWYRIRGRI